MRDADMTDELRILLEQSGPDGGDLGNLYVLTAERRSISDPRLHLWFPTWNSAVDWFHWATVRPEGSTRQDAPPGSTLRAYAPESLLLASFEVLGTAEGVVPVRPRHAGPRPWVPASVGPGVLVNERNGRSLPFERIQLLAGESGSEWGPAGRSFNLFPIGGPCLRMPLLAPPHIDAARSEDRRGLAPDLVLKTFAGTLRTRRIIADDLDLLSRAARGASRAAQPPRVTVDEVEELLELAAAAGHRARSRGSELNLAAYRTGVRDIERFEVLLDEEGTEAIGLRYRINRPRGGSAVRVAEPHDGATWLSTEESLVRAAEDGWTRSRTHAIRPETVEHFLNVGTRPLAAWFVGLCADGIDDWSEVADEHRLGVLDAALAWTEAEEDAAREEAGAKYVQELAEREHSHRVDRLRHHLEEWLAETGQDELPWAELMGLVERIVPSPPSEEAEYDDPWSAYDIESEHDYQLELGEEWQRWYRWVDDSPEEGYLDCPISLYELVDRVAPFATTREEEEEGEEGEEQEEGEED